ncbi:MAG: hypothetical protein ACXVF0_09815 [Blastococcus sp.]
MLTSTRDRIAAATGALFVVLVMVGSQIDVAGTDQSAHPGGASVLHDAAAQAHSTSAAIGFTLEFLGFMSFMVFLGNLLDLRSRTSTPGSGAVASATAFCAGLTMLIIKLASAVPMGVVLLDHAGMGPDVARVLNDMGGVAFVLSWLPYAVFVGAAALGLRRARLVGRPTAIIGAVVGAAGLLLSLISLENPIDGNPMAWMAGLLWTLVVSVRLAVRPWSGARGPVEESAAAPVPAAV